MTTGNNALFRALGMNAAFSASSAVLMLLAADWLAAQLGLAEPTYIYVVAAALLLFALQLGNIVRTRQFHVWEVRGIIGGDLAWVVASVVLLAIYYESLTTIGLLLVDVVAVIVLLLAVLQIRALRELPGRKTALGPKS